MLTIHKPIVMTVARDLLKLKEGFAQRIQANYEMTAARLTPADMLHFITTPPNAYLSKSEMAFLVSRFDMINSQQVKLQLINNMLNRIFVSDTSAMTYQDRVFVSCIMNKVGVTDVKRFVQQFWQMQNDIRNVQQLTSLYQLQRQRFQVFFKHQKETLAYQKEQNKEAMETQKSEYWLHQSIFERLHTGEIYSEIHDFINASKEAGGRLEVSEIQISEQAVSAQNILLNQYKNQAYMESHILLYNHLNAYELGGTATVSESYEQTVSDIVGAALLNVLTQAYAVCLGRHLQMQSNWYAITDVLYQSAQNTLSRFKSYYHRFQICNSDKEESYETLQRYQKVEIELLQQIFAHSDTALVNADNIRNTAAFAYQYGTVSQHESSGNMQNHERTLLPLDGTRHYAIGNTNVDSKNISHEEQILNQLAIMNQNNLERLEQIHRITAAYSRDGDQRIDMEKARKDVLRVIENPDAAVREEAHSENQYHVSNVLQNRELRQVLGEETIRAFEEIKRMQERGDSPGGMEEESIKAFDMLVHDISAVLLYEQIKNNNRKQYIEELERVKSVTHTDLETRRRREYDTNVINLEKAASFDYYNVEHYQKIHSRMQKSEESHETRLKLLHRQSANKISEETLEELIRSNRQAFLSRTEMTENLRNADSAAEQTNHTSNAITPWMENDIAQMIAQNINRQLGALSDQVYTKLERRMDLEQRRRGG